MIVTSTVHEIVCWEQLNRSSQCVLKNWQQHWFRCHSDFCISLYSLLYIYSLTNILLELISVREVVFSLSVFDDIVIQQLIELISIN